MLEIFNIYQSSKPTNWTFDEQIKLFFILFSVYRLLSAITPFLWNNSKVPQYKLRIRRSICGRFKGGRPAIDVLIFHLKTYSIPIIKSNDSILRLADGFCCVVYRFARLLLTPLAKISNLQCSQIDCLRTPIWSNLLLNSGFLKKICNICIICDLVVYSVEGWEGLGNRMCRRGREVATRALMAGIVAFCIDLKTR